MNHEEVQARLRDASQGDLAPVEREAIAEHLGHCTACARELAALEDVASRLRVLPRSVLPARDPWPEIRARLAPAGTRSATFRPSARWRAWIPRPAVGFALATLVALLVVMLFVPREASIVPQGSPASDALQLEPTVWALEVECTALGKQILAALTGPPTKLSPPVASTFQESLASLDRAIAEIYTALEEYPDDPGLMRRLTDQYRRKVRLLRHATSLASELTA